MESDFVFSDDFDVYYQFDSNIHSLLKDNQTVFILNKSSHLVDLIGDDANDFINDFTDTQGQAEEIGHTWYYSKNNRVLLLLNKDKCPAKLRKIGVKIVDICLSLKIYNIGVFIPKEFEVNDMKHIFQSSILWNYKFQMKTKEKPKLMKQIAFYIENSQSEEDEKELEFYKIAAKSTLFVRDLVNTRANIATPSYLEKVIKCFKEPSSSIAALDLESNEAEFKFGIVNSDKITRFGIIKGKELDDQGLKVFYSVGKGAADDPRLIHLLYNGNPESSEVDYAIVGKGITFDTGGVNLKSAPEDMYCDKTGCCTCIGVLKGLMELDLKINVCFCFAIAENSLDGNSYRPSDIIKSYKGLTVEVANTDAEGRLILIDAFAYIQEQYKPKHMIDLATLTGTTQIALGSYTNGLFTNDMDFAELYKKRGEEMHEKSWIMPIFEEHKEEIKSDVADLVNRCPDMKGHSSRASAFMLNFIEEDTKWVHVDFYGPAHLSKPYPPMPKYATGFNTQTVLNILRKS